MTDTTIGWTVSVSKDTDIAGLVSDLPSFSASPDPYDNYLLTTASAGAADFLVAGDSGS